MYAPTSHEECNHDVLKPCTKKSKNLKIKTYPKNEWIEAKTFGHFLHGFPPLNSIGN